MADDESALRPFSASLPMGLLRARESAMRRFRPLLAEHGLSEQQWRVLRTLADAADELDAGELAARTLLLPPSLSRILTNLDDRGLIERTVSRLDQRRSLITIRPAGRALVDRVGPRSEEIYREIEAQFGAERLRRLLDELDALADADTGDAER